MARDFAAPFYNSKLWRKCRRAFIREREAIDGGTCQMCKKHLGYIVHHTVWLILDNIGDPDITLNHDLLMYVCLDCHNKIEQEGDEQDYYFDDEGQLISMDDGRQYPP